jgi:hypothetical protein
MNYGGNKDSAATYCSWMPEGHPNRTRCAAHYPPLRFGRAPRHTRSPLAILATKKPGHALGRRAKCARRRPHADQNGNICFNSACDG